MDEKYIPLSAALSVAAAWCPDDDGSVGKTGDLREMLDELEAIEPADVRPVVRGEWDDGRCTACGKRWDEDMYAHADDDGYFDPLPPFCNNCGADMRPEPGKEEA